MCQPLSGKRYGRLIGADRRIDSLSVCKSLQTRALCSKLTDDREMVIYMLLAVLRALSCLPVKSVNPQFGRVKNKHIHFTVIQAFRNSRIVNPTEQGTLRA